VTSAALNTDRGWLAELRLGFRRRTDRTVLVERKRTGPLAVQRPFYPEGPVCHVYLLHPPGGVVGGDRLEIDVDAAAQSQVLVTTPGATKFYRSASAVASQQVRLRVGAGASLEWFPQENILFSGADVSLRTEVELASDARLALWEIHCLGRPVIDESFERGRLDSRLTIRRDGRPLLMERLRIAGLEGMRRSQLAGHPVTATLLLNGAGDADRDAARALLPWQADGYTGVTRIDDMLLVRYLGRSTEQARDLFAAVWARLRPSLLGVAATMPRIWST
jgi:urease accessory protein